MNKKQNREYIIIELLKKCGIFIEKCGTLLYKSVVVYNMCQSVAHRTRHDNDIMCSNVFLGKF